MSLRPLVFRLVLRYLWVLWEYLFLFCWQIILLIWTHISLILFLFFLFWRAGGVELDSGHHCDDFRLDWKRLSVVSGGPTEQVDRRRTRRSTSPPSQWRTKTLRLIGLVLHRNLLKFQFRHKLSFLLFTFFFFCVLKVAPGGLNMTRRFLKVSSIKDLITDWLIIKNIKDKKLNNITTMKSKQTSPRFTRTRLMEMTEQRRWLGASLWNRKSINSEQQRFTEKL